MKKLNVLADVDADVTWILTLVEVPEWITEAVAPTTAGEIITIGNNDAGSICLSRIAVMTEVWLAGSVTEPKGVAFNIPNLRGERLYDTGLSTRISLKVHLVITSVLDVEDLLTYKKY